MRLTFPAMVLLASIACAEQIHGTGTLYLYNGTDQRATVNLDGRTRVNEVLRSRTGKLVEDCIAGEYQVSIAAGEGFPALVVTEVVKDRLTIINVDAAGCFARADVAGMYNKKKAPVRLLQLYRELVISIPDEIGVLPGRRMPNRRPKNAFAFQRVAVVPCEVAEDDWTVEDFLQKQR
jgi:hypothetical protein